MVRIGEIKNYMIQQFGGVNTSYRYGCTIALLNNRHLGTIYFHKNTNTIPATDSRINGICHIHLHVNEFSNTIDILRNEKPLYLDYVEGNWNIGWLSSSAEPVGDGENPP